MDTWVLFSALPCYIHPGVNRLFHPGYKVSLATATWVQIVSVPQKNKIKSLSYLHLLNKILCYATMSKHIMRRIGAMRLNAETSTNYSFLILPPGALHTRHNLFFLCKLIITHR